MKKKKHTQALSVEYGLIFYPGLMIDFLAITIDFWVPGTSLSRFTISILNICEGAVESILFYMP